MSFSSATEGEDDDAAAAAFRLAKMARSPAQPSLAQNFSQISCFVVPSHFRGHVDMSLGLLVSVRLTDGLHPSLHIKEFYVRRPGGVLEVEEENNISS